MNTSARPEPFDFAPLRTGCAPALMMARFDSGRFAAYAQRERKRYGAESKGKGGTLRSAAPSPSRWRHRRALARLGADRPADHAMVRQPAGLASWRRAVYT